MKKQKKQFFYFLIGGIVTLLVSLFFRLYPLLFPLSLESEEKATILIKGQIKADLFQQVEKSLPGLSTEERLFLAQQQFRQTLSEQKSNIQQAIRKTARIIHEQKIQEQTALGKRPEIYLIGSDGYYFYGLTKDIARGNPVMEKRDGPKYFNPMMLAPVGYWEAVSFFPFTGYGVYRIIRLFYPEASLMLGVSFTSPFFIILSGIFFLLVCATLGLPALASSMALLFFLASRIVLHRSLFGWYDNDPVTLLFSLMALWFFLSGLKQRDRPLKSIFLGVACGGSLTLYAFFWQGWVYLLSVFMLAAGLITLFFLLIKRDAKELKRSLGFFASVFGTTALGSIYSFGFNGFLSLFIEGLSVLKDFISPQISVWPDLYIAVGELHKASPKKFLELTGGLLFIFLGFFGIAWSIYIAVKKRLLNNLLDCIILLVFFLSSLALAISSQRFILLFAMPLSLFCAFGFQAIYHALRQLPSYIPIDKKLKNILYIVFATLLTLSFSISPIRRSHNFVLNIRPIFDETWNAALTRIRLETPEDSIINSWWPPGHFIKGMAERRVISDGGTISVPQAYWMGHVFLSQNERTALGILRMLNTSANKAVTYLENLGLKTSEAVDILKKITPLPKNNAKSMLLKSLSLDDARSILDLTHGNPPAAYLFLYNDLIDQYIGVALVGNWDLTQMEQIIKISHLQKKVQSMSPTDYIHFLWDLQGGRPRISESLQEVSRQGSTILFEQGVSFDLEQKTSRLASAKFGQGIPQSIVFVDNGVITEKTMAQANLGFSVLFFQEDAPLGPYTAIIMDRPIANSLLMKLYYLKGQGLRYFKLFDEQRSIGGRTILYTYKIDWKRYLEDLGE